MAQWMPGALLGGLLALVVTLPLAVALTVIGRQLQGRLAAAEARALRDAQSLQAERQWQALVRAVLDTAPEAIARTDRGGNLVELNRQAAEVLAARQIPLAEAHVGDLFPTHAAQMVIEHLARATELGRPLSFEFLYQGGSAYAETRVFPAGDGEAVLVTRDLTQKKAKEEFLHRSKERYALAVQGANDGLWDWNLETGEVYFSWAWRAMLGYEPNDVVNTPEAWFSRVFPEDLAEVRAALDGHLTGSDVRFESEHRVRLPDGRWLWVLARGMAVRDAQGAPKRIAGSLTDLTNRRAVAVSQEKAHLLEHATSSVGIGVAVLLGDGSLTRVSPILGAMMREWADPSAWWRELRETLSWPPRSTCLTCGGPQLLGTALAEVGRPPAPGEPAGSAPADHAVRVFEVAFTGHAHEIGEEAAHVLLVKDVTDRVLAERDLKRLNEHLVIARDQALAASRAKSAFLANMSHELRTPLNHILGYAEMLSEQARDDDRTQDLEDLERIRSSANGLLELIAGILDLSNIEVGLAEAAVVAFDVRATVEEVLASVRPDAERNGNTLALRCEPTIGKQRADLDKVRAILVQLTSNAARFTRGGSIEIRVEVTTRNGREWMVYEVVDTGIGMTPEQVGQLADGFYAARGSGTRERGGSGLGLTLVWRYVELMGGSIDVQSEPGRGSRFRVVLPRDLAP